MLVLRFVYFRSRGSGAPKKQALKKIRVFGETVFIGAVSWGPFVDREGIRVEVYFVTYVVGGFFSALFVQSVRQSILYMQEALQ